MEEAIPKLMKLLGTDEITTEMIKYLNEEEKEELLQMINEIN